MSDHATPPTSRPDSTAPSWVDRWSWRAVHALPTVVIALCAVTMVVAVVDPELNNRDSARDVLLALVVVVPFGYAQHRHNDRCTLCARLAAADPTAWRYRWALWLFHQARLYAIAASLTVLAVIVVFQLPTVPRGATTARDVIASLFGLTFMLYLRAIQIHARLSPQCPRCAQPDPAPPDIPDT